MTVAAARPYSAKRDRPFDKDAQIVIVGGGPAGIHFAHRLKEAGYTRRAIVLEAEDRIGGKSHTKVFDAYPTVRHEMGTCYMHLGYDPVRKLFERYGLDDQEVELGRAYMDRKGDGVVRKVWDLQQQNDFSRGDNKGQDFDDWVLTEIDQMTHKDQKRTPSLIRRTFNKLLEWAREDPEGFETGAGVAAKDAKDALKVDLQRFEDRFNEQLDAGAKAHTDEGRPGDFEDAEGREVQGAALIAAALRSFLAVRKYLRLHKDMFGDYTYGLPPKPQKPEELDKTFDQWLKDHDLDVLKPFFIYSQAAQGYGSMETVPALYGLWWNAPGYIDPTFNPVKQWLMDKPPQAVMKCGFSALWENIAAIDKLDVRTHSKVTEITRPRASGEKCRVTYRQEKPDEQPTVKKIEADFVVLTSALKETMEAGIFEPTDTERELLSKLRILSLKTTLFRCDPYPESDPVYPGEVWVGPLNKFNGHVRYLSNSDLSVSGRNIEARPAYVVYQALDKPPSEETNKELRKMFYTDVEAIGLKNVEFLYEKNWAYFPHFPQEAVRDMAPWKLLEEQGKKGILFTGSSCCFESVLDVMAYNDLLFEMFQLGSEQETE